MMKKTIVLILLAGFLLSASAHAELLPRSVSVDKRVKIVTYDPNNVVIIRARYGYQMQIVFAPGETVQNVSIGDSLAWQAVPANNNLFIKPVVASQTNMTVLTNANSYNFQLDSTDSTITPTYKLQFIYPNGGYDAAGNTNAIGACDPAKINWKYSFTGDRTLAPVEAFDCNGQFTYFKFKNDGMSAVPAIFIVDKNKKETLVNYHMQGNYVVVNTIAKQFTLRNGSDVTSVYNDYAIGDWKNIR